MTTDRAMAHPVSLIDALGPPPADEGFYRVKITGNGETKWFNISPAELAAFRAVLAERV